MIDTQAQLRASFVPGVTLWYLLKQRRNFVRKATSPSDVADLHFFARFGTHIPTPLLLGSALRSGAFPASPSQCQYSLIAFQPTLSISAMSAISAMLSTELPERTALDDLTYSITLYLAEVKRKRLTEKVKETSNMEITLIQRKAALLD